MATLKSKRQGLVTSYGRMWARNKENILRLRGRGKLQGLYILYDGSMPVYVGHGRLSPRLGSHGRSNTRGRFWDYFSWYAIPNEVLQKDAEALLIKTLPYYLRLLNRQNEGFAGPQHGVKQSKNHVPQEVRKPKFVKLKKVG